MRSSRALLVVAVLLAVTGTATAGAAQCRAGDDPGTGLYPSGTSPRYGQPDGRWTVVPAGAVGGAPTAAISVRPVPGLYITPFGGKTWIASSGLLTGDSDTAAALGVYRYETTITFPPGATYVSLALGYAIDNDVVWRVNGTVVDSWNSTGNDATGWGALHGFAIDNAAPLQTGVNTLTAEVTNRGAWEGLYVFGGSLYCI